MKRLGKNQWFAVILAVFCGILLVETGAFRQQKSLTYDETFYLSCTLQSIHDRQLDVRLAAWGVAPLPILIDYFLPLTFSQRQNRLDPWEGQLNDAQLIHGPRFANTLLIGTALVLVVSIWLYRRHSLLAAVLGAGLVVFSPSILAHVSLATTDSCLALLVLVALATIAAYFKKPSRGRLWAMTIAVGAAMAAKYSGVFLIGVIGLMLALRATIDRNTNAEEKASWLAECRGVLTRFVLLVAMIMVAWWGFHLFSFADPLKTTSFEETPADSPWVKVLGRGPLAERIMRVSHQRLKWPAPVEGVLIQIDHNRRGHVGHLMGQRSDTGWWYYFPLAFLFKSTLVELSLTGGLLVLLAISLRRPWQALRSLDIEMQVLILAAMVFIAMVMTARINIGQRYLLPLYPILIVIAVDRLCVLAGRQPKQLRVLAIILLAGQATSAIAISPHYLAYFNSIVGGPRSGQYLLADSNIDWGQDLPLLADHIKDQGYQRVAIEYFGSADPAAYGIEADPVPELTHKIDQYDVFAVSVTKMLGMYLDIVSDVDPYRELRQIEPTARAGYSIWIYDLSDPATREAFQLAMKRLGSDNHDAN